MAFFEDSEAPLSRLAGGDDHAPSGTVDSAVDAIKRGAFDYVTKPFEQSRDRFRFLQKAVNTYRLKKRMSVDSVSIAPAVPELSVFPALARRHIRQR